MAGVYQAGGCTMLWITEFELLNSGHRTVQFNQRYYLFPLQLAALKDEETEAEKAGGF